MKILSATQTHLVDQVTIEQEPIPSIDLMERASGVFTNWFCEHYFTISHSIQVLCGMGNNGGDGLAIARLLFQRGYAVTVFLANVGANRSADNAINLRRLEALEGVGIQSLSENDPFPSFPDHCVLIDGLFGSGLSRPVEGYWAALLAHCNTGSHQRVAIDLPSGLYADRARAGIAFRADRTLSFQLPKLAFFVPENGPYVGEWSVRDIGLSETAIAEMDTNYLVNTPTELRSLLRSRGRFDHKGTFGHVLMVAGSFGKMGACILSSRAALRAGAGLLTIHAPYCAYELLQTSVPEAMVEMDRHRSIFSEIGSLEKYRAVGVGPGIGTDELTKNALEALLRKYDKPMVLDADALNLVAKYPELWALVPKGSILTPHPKEFERLFGPAESDFARLELQRNQAEERGIVLLLKTGHTSIATPGGHLYFNTTGNPGMGTAGTGDVLTGILTGLLAQGYPPISAARLGVYLHGLSGDLAAVEMGQEALLAGEVVTYLGRAFRALRVAPEKKELG